MNYTFSIVIPVYNRPDFIMKCLRSVYNQSVNFAEVIVVDDCSTDNTYNILLELQERYNFVLLQQAKNSGAQVARNAGVKLSKSDYILLLDSDNTLRTDYVQKVSEYLTQHPDVDVVTNYSKIIDETGEFTQTAFEWKTEGNILNELLTERTYVDNSSACIRREKLIEIGFLDVLCPSFQEWDTHIRLAKTCNYGYIPEYLTNYYIHKGDRISVSTKHKLGKGLYVLKKHQQLWLLNSEENVFKRLVLHAYDNLIKNAVGLMKFRILISTVRFYPTIIKVLIKRSINALGKKS